MYTWDFAHLWTWRDFEPSIASRETTKDQMTRMRQKLAGKRFFKIFNAKENHRGFQYKTGLNELSPDEPFNANQFEHCCGGGLYFAEEKDIMHFIDYGVWIREVILPWDDPTFQMIELDGIMGDPRKYRANKFFLRPRVSLCQLRIVGRYYKLPKMQTDFMRHKIIRSTACIPDALDRLSRLLSSSSESFRNLSMNLPIHIVHDPTDIMKHFIKFAGLTPEDFIGNESLSPWINLFWNCCSARQRTRMIFGKGTDKRHYHGPKRYQSRPNNKQTNNVQTIHQPTNNSVQTIHQTTNNHDYALEQRTDFWSNVSTMSKRQMMYLIVFLYNLVFLFLSQIV